MGSTGRQGLVPQFQEIPTPKTLTIIRPKNGSSRQERAPKTRPQKPQPRAQPRVARHSEPPVNSIGGEIRSRFTADQQRVAQAYLNAGHADNYANAMPLPDSYPGRRYVSKVQWSRDVNVASVSAGGETGLNIMMVPFVEYPFLIGPIGGNLKGVANPRTLDGKVTPMNFLKDKGVYGYRCLGKTLTVYDQTPLTARSGNIMVGHKAPDVDLTSPVFNDNALATDNANIWTIQACPNTTTQLSLAGGYYTRDTEEGCYMQAHHVDNDWRLRDLSYKKMGGAIGGVQLNTWNQNTISFYDTAGANKSVLDIDNPTLKCCVSPPDNTDITICSIDGINANTTLQLKFTCVYEFVLKYNSALMQESVSAPLYDPQFLALLRAYEVARSRLAGGGTLPSRDNDWNSIWNGFKNFVANVSRGALTVASNLTGIYDWQSALSAAGRVAPFALSML